MRAALGQLMPCALLFAALLNVADAKYHEPKQKIDDDESRTCSSVEFQCKNGRCIPERWQCDNEKDCSDGSDEDPNTCQNRRCDDQQYQCSPGVCIAQAWVCDGTPDCPNGTEEEHCSK